MQLELPEGHLNYTLRLHPEAAARGAHLTVTATWFTAARDRLQEALHLPIRDSPWRATLAMASGLDTRDVLPQWPFDVVLTLHHDDAAAALAPSPPVADFRLVPLPPTGGSSRAQLFERGAVIPAAEPADAGNATRRLRTVTVPSVGRYRVVARITDAAGATSYPALDVGRTMAQWRRSPLTALPTAPPRLLVAPGGVGAGEDTVLAWRSPFARGRALLQWGSAAAGLRTRLYDVRAGDNRFAFRVGAECRRGCDVTGYVLGYGTAEARPVAVPTSQVRDDALPQAVRFEPLAVPLREERAAVGVDIDVGGRALPGAEHNVTFRYVVWEV